MLLENFYKIIHRKEREDGKREIEIELNPGHALYQGHFSRTAGGSGRLYLTDDKRKCRTDRSAGLCSMYRLLLPNSYLPSIRLKLRYCNYLSD